MRWRRSNKLTVIVSHCGAGLPLLRGPAQYQGEMGMTDQVADVMPAEKPAKPKGPLVYRQSIFTRLTHWIWAIALFFLLHSGLQIWNAHPALYIGEQSGFEFDSSVLSIGAENTPEGVRVLSSSTKKSFSLVRTMSMPIMWL